MIFGTHGSADKSHVVSNAHEYSESPEVIQVMTRGNSVADGEIPRMISVFGSIPPGQNPWLIGFPHSIILQERGKHIR